MAQACPVRLSDLLLGRGVKNGFRGQADEGRILRGDLLRRIPVGFRKRLRRERVDGATIMAIRDFTAFKRQHWDWTELETALPGNIRIGDLDGLIERKGHLFIIEGKGLGVPIPEGQRIMYENLTRYSRHIDGRPNITVMVCWGDPSRGIWEENRVYWAGQSEERTHGLGGAKAILGGWYGHANSDAPPSLPCPTCGR